MLAPVRESSQTMSKSYQRSAITLKADGW